MSTLAQLSDQLGVSERTLRRAANCHLVRVATEVGRDRSISASEWRYLVDHWQLLSRLRQVLRTEPNVSLAILFGSTARGTDTAESDIDIAVELREDSLEKLIDLRLRLMDAFDRELELVRLRDIEGEPLLADELLRDGRVLIDRDGGWDRLVADVVDVSRRAATRREHLHRDAASALDAMVVGA